MASFRVGSILNLCRQKQQQQHYYRQHCHHHYWQCLSIATTTRSRSTTSRKNVINNNNHARYFSSTLSSSKDTKLNDNKNDIDKHRVIVLNLYRQLLRWCKETPHDIPLSSFIPPIYIHAPQINVANLRRNYKTLSAFFPIQAQEQINIMNDSSTQITCPIFNKHDLYQFLRGIFRCNANDNNENNMQGNDISNYHQKEQISNAFSALKSLNQLSQSIAQIQQKQQSHLDRTNVQFCVGQVVQHKTERWRGVIIDWERIDYDDDENKSMPDPSSLTMKTYQVTDPVKYQIILDSGDAHVHYLKRQDPGDMGTASVLQSHLQLVTNTSLTRIRSTFLDEHFSGYNVYTHTFVPNDMKAFEYPNDEVITTKDNNDDIKSKNDDDIKSAQAVIDGIQEFAKSCKRIILNETSAPEARKLKLLEFFMGKLTRLQVGHVAPTEYKYKHRHGNNNIPPKVHAIMHLRQLSNFVSNLSELTWHRQSILQQQQQQDKNDTTTYPILYRLGDIVQHKVYGFRGVIVAWDAKPIMDVTNWDGLKHVVNPQDQPFYHIIPDQEDCIKAFGGERPSRYVCQENLEICPIQDRSIDVDLEPEWEYNVETQSFIAPADLKYKYGEDLDDDGITERCMKELQNHVAKLFVACRDGMTASTNSQSTNDDNDDDDNNNNYNVVNDTTTTNNKTNIDNDVVSKFQIMNHLFHLLQAAESLEDATIISEVIKEIWKAHENFTIRWKLDSALGELLKSNVDIALSLFLEIIVVKNEKGNNDSKNNNDNYYAEAWNKIATCHFMMGDFESSKQAALETIRLIPNHYQALNGLGLVYYETGNLPAAIETFEKSIKLDPWSPVSSRLSSCLDDYNKKNDNDGSKN